MKRWKTPASARADSSRSGRRRPLPSGRCDSRHGTAWRCHPPKTAAAPSTARSAPSEDPPPRSLPQRHPTRPPPTPRSDKGCHPPAGKSPCCRPPVSEGGNTAARCRPVRPGPACRLWSATGTRPARSAADTAGHSRWQSGSRAVGRRYSQMPPEHRPLHRR